MSIPNDPIILLSYINTLLRDQYPSLEELCKAFDVPQQQITEKLAAVGYTYDAEQNRFR